MNNHVRCIPTPNSLTYISLTRPQILVELHHSRNTDPQSCVAILRFASQLVRFAPAPVLTPGSCFIWEE